jgi:hypothetical protein
VGNQTAERERCHASFFETRHELAAHPLIADLIFVRGGGAAAAAAGGLSAPQHDTAAGTPLCNFAQHSLLPLEFLFQQRNLPLKLCDLYRGRVHRRKLCSRTHTASHAAPTVRLRLLPSNFTLKLPDAVSTLLLHDHNLRPRLLQLIPQPLDLGCLTLKLLCARYFSLDPNARVSE